MRPAPRVRRLSGLPPSLGSDERDRRGARRRGSRADRPAAGRRPLLLGRPLRSTATPPEEIGEAFDIPEHALAPLLSFGHVGRPSRKFHADTEHVVFPFHCYLEADGAEKRRGRVAGSDRGQRPRPRRLHPHRPSRGGLAAGAPSRATAPRGAASSTSSTSSSTRWSRPPSTRSAPPSWRSRGCRSLAGEAGNARVRAGTLRAINVRLTRMRRRLGPAAGQVRADRPGDRPGRRAWSPTTRATSSASTSQINRLIDGIDAAADSMAKVMNLRMNETIYWLTVVATIFLPLTFMTGFFGMNFGWMVGEIDNVRRVPRRSGSAARSSATRPDLAGDQQARDPGPARPGRARTPRHDAAPSTSLSAPRRSAATDGTRAPSQRCTARTKASKARS